MREFKIQMAMAVAASMALSGCAVSGDHVASAPQPIASETIAVSVGPCFGFCPVYDVTIAPDGTVSFSGKRHTATVGERKRNASIGVYRSVARQLAPFRPADGTSAHVACDAAISDTSSYTIVWTSAGGRTTTATHKRGCHGGPGQALDKALANLPKQLGIADWARQTTRPNAQRG